MSALTKERYGYTLNKKDIIDALKYIDENGVPFHDRSMKYELVAEDGKRYPPKYVPAVADHIANGTDISVEGFNTAEAVKNHKPALYNYWDNE